MWHSLENVTSPVPCRTLKCWYLFGKQTLECFSKGLNGYHTRCPLVNALYFIVLISKDPNKKDTKTWVFPKGQVMWHFLMNVTLAVPWWMHHILSYWFPMILTKKIPKLECFSKGLVMWHFTINVTLAVPWWIHHINSKDPNQKETKTWVFLQGTGGVTFSVQCHTHCPLVNASCFITLNP